MDTRNVFKNRIDFLDTDFDEESMLEALRLVDVGSHVILNTYDNFPDMWFHSERVRNTYDINAFAPAKETLTMLPNGWVVNKKFAQKDVINQKYQWLRALGLHTLVS